MNTTTCDKCGSQNGKRRIIPPFGERINTVFCDECFAKLKVVSLALKTDSSK